MALQHPHPRLLQLAHWLTPAFYIDFGRPCNSACIYCAVPPHEDAQGFLPFAEVESIVAAGKQTGCDRAILIGGEPTIYPQLPQVLTALRDADLRDHIVMTNGLRLADPAFVTMLADNGVASVHLSLDTTDADTYDRLSRSTGKLGKQLQALHNVLREPRLNLYLYTATSALNAPHLPQMLVDVAQAAKIAGVVAPPVVLAVIKPLGDAARHADQLLLAPRHAVDIVRHLVQLGDELGIAVGHRNLQACLAPDLIDRNVDYYLDDYSVQVATGQRLPFSHGQYWYKLPSCSDCGHFDLCTGLYRDTTARYGESEYVPIGRLELGPEPI